MCRQKGQSYKKKEELSVVISLSINQELLDYIDTNKTKSRSAMICDIIRNHKEVNY